MEAIKSLWGKLLAAGPLMQIIWINIALFVGMRLAVIFAMFGGVYDASPVIIDAVSVPGTLHTLFFRPWTPLTYMFAQYDVFHIVFNMIWLYWFGTLFVMAAPQRSLLPLYLLGGLGGAVMFILGQSLFLMPAHTYLIGSSAAVLAIVTATAIMIPDFRMSLILFGPVKIKWIALVTIALVLLGVSGHNAGGELAHIGGIGIGAWYALALKRGTDITRSPSVLLDDARKGLRQLFSKKTQNTSSASPAGGGAAPGASPKISEEDRRELDRILDKIKSSGYSALTPYERKRLFEVSRNIR